ncbi:hypothetical protein TCE0_044f16187 [Talaromyces pinophilus]|uniref:Uncharacterized protein n=1 Tax=Talaromyces pinophilus TaxID=128442 RepID=A0A478EB83_TALPI|nr:hypothetical protein TCE0_044f16187 [Talaromyces pinophilus]
MTKGTYGSPWVILSPNKLPDASERKKILGAIVPDYENPLQNTIPEDVSSILPKEWFAGPTEDENFKVVVESAKGRNVRARLGDILQSAFNSSIDNNLHLTSTIVRTYVITQEIKCFELLKDRFKDQILSTLKSGGKNGTIVPLPVNADIEVGRDDQLRAATERGQVAKRERIFAVQYRLIKRRSEWFRFLKTLLVDITMMGYGSAPGSYGLISGHIGHTCNNVSSNVTYGGGKAAGKIQFGEQQEQEQEQAIDSVNATRVKNEQNGEIHDELNHFRENDINDDDVLELGAPEYTWSLSDAGRDGVILVTL